ncbi:hypothetical protein NtRootA4_40930 [Arthrobacter sp. NtRootA4]|nr:hypothetical protein NtRootA2_02050 [Arthrobacter sp. NtRootA2]BCW17114.1 hypothetical protein NtRootA4_40930 [Arthrobacter sp. NtRootA4]BCW21338.1 hypothetical protein NtRootC7_02050 [Arthrobacter sp. NtRootC7]BCW25605.1 hypothetical protein NtRootC45_02050 [Arthrobacter sp. NtRootC45]BCW29874.1 hypothetical protein NtRootD5_02050 [Arthrobacter sp. NtRootD5]
MGSGIAPSRGGEVRCPILKWGLSLVSNHKPPGTSSFRLPKSTIIVGILALVFIVSAAFSSGFGGVMVMLALFGLGTGLYVLVTGRRSWALVRGGRKAGAIVLVSALVLMFVGAAITPVKSSASLEASQGLEEAQKLASTNESPSSTPTPSPTPQDAGAPLDPDTTTAVAATATYTPPRSQPTYATKALDLLATLPVKGRAPKTGFDRNQFGQAWADVDRNGCDTRNDILKRDLTQVTFTNSVPCKIQSGVLSDPYTSKTISFVRGSSTSAAVQIDHVVALGDAWQKGAQQLTPEQRTAFANDPMNLQSTDGPTNAQKSDGDAATWLPPNKPFRCDYVARQISVKATYNLWVTQAEHDAMAKVLENCTNQIAPTNEKAPPTATPATTVVAESEPAKAAVPVTVEPAPAQAAVPAAPAVPAPVVPAPAAPAPVPAAPAPAPAQAPGGGATALCNDGTLSFSATHRGTCSHHGGVAVWYK